MKKFVRSCFLLTVTLIGTQIIRLPVIHLSLFQLSVMFSTVVGTIFVFERGIRSGAYLKVSALWLISSILAWMISINPQWAKSYFLLGLMTTALFFLIPNIFSRKDVPQIAKWLIRSQYIVIPFSLFTLMYFNSVGSFPDEIPLPLGMSISLSEETLERGTAAGEVRLMLPYPTPPVLSVIMSMCITILFFAKSLFPNKVRWTLFSIFTWILIMTGSRTGLVAIFILIILLWGSRDLSQYTQKIKTRYIFFAGVVLLVVVFIALQSEYFQKMIINRFYNPDREGLYEDRHFLVPLDGILIWIKSLKNLILGIGFGSSAMMRGEHTFLPPYFLNSFVTTVTERGIMGLILVLSFVKLFLRLFKRRKYMTEVEKAILYAFFVGLVSAVFYEIFISYFVLISIAFAMMLDTFMNHLIKIRK